MTHTVPTDYPDWVRAMERRVQTVERNLGGAGTGGGGEAVVAPFWGRLQRSTAYASLPAGTDKAYEWQSIDNPSASSGVQPFATWNVNGITIPADGIYSLTLRVGYQSTSGTSRLTSDSAWVTSSPSPAIVCPAPCSSALKPARTIGSPGR